VRRILTDRHQGDLLHSLQLLFEDRLGYELYVPVGYEWWHEWIWRFGEVYGDARLADQFLRIDSSYELVDVGGSRPPHYVTYDRHHPSRVIRTVTLAQARRMDWALVMPTVPENERGYRRFADEVHAHYLVEVGNNNQAVNWALKPLALVAGEIPTPPDAHWVRARQEFDVSNDYHFGTAGAAVGRIGSFVNCFPSTDCWPEFERYRARLSPEGFQFRVHGIDGADGNLSPSRAVADAMRLCSFGWHDKPQGDGFGHVIHAWAAIGRPLIGHASHYKGCLAEPFWEDGVTCVDLDAGDVEDNLALIREIAVDGSKWDAMCHAIHARFLEFVDFDAEAAAIAAAIADLG
jgi:hypothetical protein